MADPTPGGLCPSSSLSSDAGGSASVVSSPSAVSTASKAAATASPPPSSSSSSSPSAAALSSSSSSAVGWVPDDLGAALRAWSSAAPPPPFAVGGPLAGFPYPSLAIAGAGDLTLPLDAAAVALLRGASEAAPFGRGADTVVDPEVRLCRQVKAAAVTVGDAAWADRLAAHVAGGLAGSLGIPLSAGVTPRLDKLVLYEEGGFFKPHTDTEKEAGMVGTLVLQLPVVGGHTGGVLSVQHGGERLDFDGSPATAPPRRAFTSPPPGPSPPLYATAFFADCVHELHPVTAGARLCLLYNLVVPAATAAGGGGSAVPRAPRGCPAAARVRHVIRTWAAEASVAACGHLVLRLMHKYTAGRLSMKALKPRDAALADLLLSETDASGAPVLEMRLAVLHKRVVGAMYGDPYEEWERHLEEREDDDEEGEEDSDGNPIPREALPGGVSGRGIGRIDDVQDEEVEVDAWVTPDGSPSVLSPFAVDPATDMIDAGNGAGFDTDASDEEIETTGNEGTTVEFRYSLAALFVWPRAHTLAVAAATGLSAAMDVVDDRLDAATPAGRADMLGQLRSCLASTRYVHGPDVARLLRLAIRVSDGGGATRQVLAELAKAKPPAYAGRPPEPGGLPTAAAGEAVADAVAAFSMDALAPSLAEAVAASASKGGAEAADALLVRLAGTTPAAVAPLLAAAAGAVTAWLRSIVPDVPDGGGFLCGLSAALRVLYGPAAAAAPAGSVAAGVVSGGRTAAVAAVRVLSPMLGAAAVEAAVTAASASGPATALAGVPAFGALLRAAIGVTFPGRQYGAFSGGGHRDEAAVTLARAVAATGVGVKAFAAAAASADGRRTPAGAIGAAAPPSVLAAVLADKAVRAAALRGPPGAAALVRALAKSRLRAVGGAGPTFTWAMPATSLPYAVTADAGVAAFFRSPTAVTTQLTGLAGLPAARRVAAAFGRGLDVAGGWSAIATPGGRGRDAYVELRKTRALHGAAVKAAAAGRAEEASLRRLLASLPPEGGGGGGGGGGEAAAAAAGAAGSAGAASQQGCAAEVIDVSDDGSDGDSPMLAAVAAAEAVAASVAAGEPPATAAAAAAKAAAAAAEVIDVPDDGPARDAPAQAAVPSAAAVAPAGPAAVVAAAGAAASEAGAALPGDTDESAPSVAAPTDGPAGDATAPTAATAAAEPAEAGSPHAAAATAAAPPADAGTPPRSSAVARPAAATTPASVAAPVVKADGGAAAAAPVATPAKADEGAAAALPVAPEHVSSTASPPGDSAIHPVAAVEAALVKEAAKTDEPMAATTTTTTAAAGNGGLAASTATSPTVPAAPPPVDATAASAPLADVKADADAVATANGTNISGGGSAAGTPDGRGAKRARSPSPQASREAGGSGGGADAVPSGGGAAGGDHGGCCGGDAGAASEAADADAAAAGGAKRRCP